jgi:hypothetical protein
MNERPVNPFDTHYYPKKGDDFWKLIELMQKGLPVTEQKQSTRVSKNFNLFDFARIFTAAGIPIVHDKPKWADADTEHDVRLHIRDGFNEATESFFEKLFNAFEECNKNEETACYLKKIDITQDFHSFFFVSTAFDFPQTVWNYCNAALNNTALLSSRRSRRRRSQPKFFCLKKLQICKLFR